MKTAMVRGLIAAALTVGCCVGFGRFASAEELSVPGILTTKPQATPRMLPRPLVPGEQPPVENGEASVPEAPSQGPGCPDPGRKLDLIV